MTLFVSNFDKRYVGFKVLNQNSPFEGCHDLDNCVHNMMEN